MSKANGCGCDAQPVKRGRTVGESIGPRVEKRVARPSAQPLETPAGRKVHAQRGDVHRDDAGGLVHVEHDRRADGLRALDDGRRVEDERRAEQHVREGDQRRAVVDGIGDAQGRRCRRRWPARSPSDTRARPVRGTVDHRRESRRLSTRWRRVSLAAAASTAPPCARR